MTGAQAPRAFLLLGQAGERQFHNTADHWALLAGILRDIDLSARVISDDLADLNAVNLARFDVILNFSTDLVATDDQIDALLNAVHSGIGFVGLHAANATFRASDAYCAMIGSRFARHPPIKRFTVRIENAEHPIIQGIDSFEIEDERYELNNVAEDMQVLAYAEGHPSIYTRQYGAGRVCYMAPGHDRRTIALPVYCKLVEQAVMWAARRRSL